MAPLVAAGIVMIWRRERARHYIEADVEWWTLIFFLTANIVALGMLEKRYRTRIHFLEWLRVGLAAGFVAGFVAWLALLITGPFMFAVSSS
jgi:Na+/H+ antiporter NhaD/arsenite permease-like protein